MFWLKILAPCIRTLERCFKLSENIKALDENKFVEYLLKIENRIKRVVRDNFISIPNNMVIRIKDETSTEFHLITFVFPDLVKKTSSVEYVTQSNALTYKLIC